jgi:WD40-like Beta Propeller Repeat
LHPLTLMKNQDRKLVRLFTTLATALAITASAWAEPANASAHDSEHVVSPDGKWHVFVRTSPGKEMSGGVGSYATELWQIGADGKNATVLVHPKDGLSGFEGLQFSNDGRYVFFLSDDFATTRGLHVVDTTNGKEHFICSAGGFEVIRSGEYKDCLLVGQRRYFIVGGAYFGLWVTRPDGKEVGPVALSGDGEGATPADIEDYDAGLAAAWKKFDERP